MRITNNLLITKSSDEATTTGLEDEATSTEYIDIWDTEPTIESYGYIEDNKEEGFLAYRQEGWMAKKITIASKWILLLLTIGMVAWFLISFVNLLGVVEYNCEAIEKIQVENEADREAFTESYYNISLTLDDISKDLKIIRYKLEEPNDTLYNKE